MKKSRKKKINNKIISVFVALLTLFVVISMYYVFFYGKDLRTIINKKTEDKKENTELHSGAYNGDFNGNTVLVNGAYIVDGIDAYIGSGEFTTDISDQVVFLVINGGSLTIENVTINKSGDANTSTNNYDIYGINSAILVIGEGSKATVSNVTINATSFGSYGIYAINGGLVMQENNIINVLPENSPGIKTSNNGVITNISD